MELRCIFVSLKGQCHGLRMCKIAFSKSALNSSREIQLYCVFSELRESRILKAKLLICEVSLKILCCISGPVRSQRDQDNFMIHQCALTLFCVKKFFLLHLDRFLTSS